MTPDRFLVPVMLLFLLGCGAGKGRLDERTASIFAGATKVEVFRPAGPGGVAG